MRTFAMGERTRLEDSAIRVEFDVSGEGLTSYCFSLGSEDLDVVCTARPASLTSAVALVAGGEGTAEFHVDLSAVDDTVERLVFAIGASAPGFGAGSVVRLHGGDGEIGRFELPVADLTRERALILVEVYRRDGWRFGAVGQGYEAGLDDLVRDLGADPERTLIAAAVAVVGGGEPPSTAGEIDPIGPVAAIPVDAVAPIPTTAPIAPEAPPGSDPVPEPDPLPAPAPVSVPDPVPVPEPAVDAAADAVGPAAPNTEPAALPSAAAAQSAHPGVHQGRGDKVLSIVRPPGTGPFLVELEGHADDTFVVWTLDADLETDKLLANVIGAHRGRALVDERDTTTTRLKIEAAGDWTVRVLPAGAAPLLVDRLEGTGPDVVRWGGPRTVLAMTHRGTSNFIVGTFTEYGGDNAYLGTLANAIGDYDGESILAKGPCLIEIEADGTWSLAVLAD